MGIPPFSFYIHNYEHSRQKRESWVVTVTMTLFSSQDTSSRTTLAACVRSSVSPLCRIFFTAPSPPVCTEYSKMNESKFICGAYTFPHKSLHLYSARYTQCIHVSFHNVKLPKDTHTNKARTAPIHQALPGSATIHGS